jgi:hypothetical protein
MKIGENLVCRFHPANLNHLGPGSRNPRSLAGRPYPSTKKATPLSREWRLYWLWLVNGVYTVKYFSQVSKELFWPREQTTFNIINE